MATGGQGQYDEMGLRGGLWRAWLGIFGMPGSAVCTIVGDSLSGLVWVMELISVVSPAHHLWPTGGRTSGR